MVRSLPDAWAFCFQWSLGCDELQKRAARIEDGATCLSIRLEGVARQQEANSYADKSAISRKARPETLRGSLCRSGSRKGST